MTVVYTQSQWKGLHSSEIRYILKGLNRSFTTKPLVLICYGFRSNSSFTGTCIRIMEEVSSAREETLVR